ncbi:MAG: DNA alkylation repair protein, partial [Actinomycetota bacterium]
MGEADPHHTAARIGELRQALTDVAEPGRAVGMAAYMKDQFPFLGVMAGPRREA